MQHATSLAVCLVLVVAAYLIGRSTLEAQQPVPTLDRQFTPGTVFADARTPISSLPYTIDRCGSYFLTACLTGIAGQNGITVNADDVSIDLNGFTISGVPGSLDGVFVSAGVSNMTLTNGTIRSWAGNGVSHGSARAVELLRLLIRDNQLNGAVLPGGRIVNCAALNNQIDGFVVEGTAIIQGCIARDNARNGITHQSAALIMNNVVHSNDGIGITRPSGMHFFSRIEANLVTENDVGIDHGGSFHMLVRNAAGGNNTDYNIGGGNVVGPIGDLSSPWANIDLDP